MLHPKKQPSSLTPRNRNGKGSDHITNVNFGKLWKDLYETHPLRTKYISRLHRVQAADEFYVRKEQAFLTSFQGNHKTRYGDKS